MHHSAELYNSRIIKTYLEYLEKYHPDIDSDELLDYAGMARYEVEDHAHWFGQHHVDRFHEILVEKTGKQDIARLAGRYTVSAEGLGAIKQYTLGLLKLSTVYKLLERINPLLSRGALVKTTKLKSNKVEITAIPAPGVVEKPYQCQNRLGTLESMAHFFTGAYPQVEHPRCVHRGDEECHYVITWVMPPSRFWHLLRNYFLLIGTALLGILFFIVPRADWLLIPPLYLVATMALSLYASHLEKRELTRTISVQGDAANYLLEETNMRYNNSLILQEIGQTTATCLDIDTILDAVMETMEKRLDFDRGVIWLADDERRQLVYRAGFGFSPELDLLLRNHENFPDLGINDVPPPSPDVTTTVFSTQDPFFIEDVHAMDQRFLSKITREMITKLDVRSLICVPLVYERESLGVLAVNTVRHKRRLTKSDMNMLMGIASHMAISIANALSFEKLQASENKYRTIIDLMDNGYFEVDLSGNLHFCNDAFCRMMGYNHQELQNINYREYMDDDNARAVYQVFHATFRTGKPGSLYTTQLRRKDGSRCDIETFVTLVTNSDGSATGFRGMTRDVTDRKQAEDEIKWSLREKEALLREIHHRVNNNMQVISSMLNLQSRHVADARAFELFQDSQVRVRTMALVHEKLYQSKNLSRIDFGEYVRHLISRLYSTYHVNSSTVRPIVDVENVVFEIETAIPCGLIVSELVSNALKYAFPGESGGDLRVTINAEAETERFVLNVSDTGVGLPAAFDLDRTDTLGLQLVRDLTEQLHGSIRRDEGPGTSFTIAFETLRYSRRI